MAEKRAQLSDRSVSNGWEQERHTIAEMREKGKVPAERFPGHKGIFMANLEGYLGGRFPVLLAERDRLRAENEKLRQAVALHAGTLDDRALGHPEHTKRDRDSIDNDLYNTVRAIDPAWWDRAVPGLAGTEIERA